ncbi:hypothetical protein AVEN_27424-1 [Araneus ventricosus]|uniref:Uncharacterized protein n=1 Tax=Araneus ventricosus TaxID=182803 RepID=A0A4Y2EJK2_ARAVE|nr:hypothetical protein AVEN_27424-1 [Araneus ventricosus]
MATFGSPTSSENFGLESDGKNSARADIVAKSLTVGVWCKQSNTQDIGEWRFIYKYAGKHAAQVQETTVLAPITNVNRQQLAGNNSSAL